MKIKTPAAASLLVLGFLSVSSIVSEFKATMGALSKSTEGDSVHEGVNFLDHNLGVPERETTLNATRPSSSHSITEADGQLNAIDGALKESSSAMSADNRPTGLRLVLIGDSITRYQYLSLAYFLRHGYWFNPKEKPHLVNQFSFMRQAPEQGQGWSHFFSETTKRLSPMEQCDCFRARWPHVKAVDGYVMENRYFHDPERNNSLAYIQAYGNTFSLLHGRVLPEDAFRDIGGKVFKHVNSTWQWSFKDWGEALERYVAPMNVTHVMMNAGLWQNNFHRNESARQSIIEALDRTGLVGIWRTNTYLTTRTLRPSSATADAAMTGLFGENVLNVSWTRGLQRKYYWDDKHFNEPVYRVMNERLLEMMGHKFTSEYEKQSISELQ